MSVRMMSLVWNVSLPPTPKLLLLALADHANDEGVCYPGQSLLSVKCGISDRSIRKHLRTLIDAGYVSVQVRPGDGDGRWSNLYVLDVGQPEDLGRQPEDLEGGNRKKMGGQPEDLGGATGKGVPKNHQNHQKNQYKTLPPEGWSPSYATLIWFADQDFGFSLDSMVETYIDGCNAKGYKYIDHDAAFKNWSKRRAEREPSRRVDYLEPIA